MQQQVKAQLDASHFTTELPPSRSLKSSSNMLLAQCSTISSTASTNTTTTTNTTSSTVFYNSFNYTILQCKC